LSPGFAATRSAARDGPRTTRSREPQGLGRDEPMVQISGLIPGVSGVKRSRDSHEWVAGRWTGVGPGCRRREARASLDWTGVTRRPRRFAEIGALDLGAHAETGLPIPGHSHETHHDRNRRNDAAADGHALSSCPTHAGNDGIGSRQRRARVEAFGLPAQRRRDRRGRLGCRCRRDWLNRRPAECARSRRGRAREAGACATHRHRRSPRGPYGVAVDADERQGQARLARPMSRTASWRRS